MYVTFTKAKKHRVLSYKEIFQFQRYIQNVQIYAYKSHSYRHKFLLRFRTENRIVNDSFSVIICCYAHYLLKICSEKWNKILNICTYNISAICTEMMNIHNDMIGLWQLLYICKAEKTH